MGPTTHETKNAGIATALLLLGVLLLGTPGVAAEEDDPKKVAVMSELEPDDECVFVNPWSLPPGYTLNPMACVPAIVPPV